MEGKTRQQPNSADRIENLADYYGYSSRRISDRIRSGQVIGVTLSSRQAVVIKVDKNGQYLPIGPVADKAQKFILPRGTTGVAIVPVNGPVSGQVYQTSLDLRQYHMSQVTLQAADGCSGAQIMLQNMT